MAYPNVILTVDESEKAKEFCILNGISWFRSEYYDKRYFQINTTDQKEIDAFQDFLNTLDSN